MAHGSPRLQICNKCNSYGLIPRFSGNKCPDCNSDTVPIERSILKRKLGIHQYKELYIGFKFEKIK